MEGKLIKHATDINFSKEFDELLIEMQPTKGWNMPSESIAGSLGFIELKDGRIAEIQLHITCQEDEFINDESENIEP